MSPDSMLAGEFLRLLEELSGNGAAGPSGAQPAAAQAVGPARPRNHGELRELQQKARREMKQSAPAAAAPPREDPARIVQRAGLERVRRTLRAMESPAAIPEVRRAVSAVAAKCGVTINPHAADGNSLVDQVCNHAPSRLAVELFATIPIATMPSVEDFAAVISTAARHLASLQELVGLHR
jgi:hypothetical protein